MCASKPFLLLLAIAAFVPFSFVQCAPMQRRPSQVPGLGSVPPPPYGYGLPHYPQPQPQQPYYHHPVPHQIFHPAPQYPHAQVYPPSLPFHRVPPPRVASPQLLGPEFSPLTPHAYDINRIAATSNGLPSSGTASVHSTDTHHPSRGSTPPTSPRMTLSGHHFPDYQRPHTPPMSEPMKSSWMGHDSQFAPDPHRPGSAPAHTGWAGRAHHSQARPSTPWNGHGVLSSAHHDDDHSHHTQDVPIASPRLPPYRRVGELVQAHHQPQWQHHVEFTQDGENVLHVNTHPDVLAASEGRDKYSIAGKPGDNIGRVMVHDYKNPGRAASMTVPPGYTPRVSIKKGDGGSYGVKVKMRSPGGSEAERYNYHLPFTSS